MKLELIKNDIEIELYQGEIFINILVDGNFKSIRIDSEIAIKLKNELNEKLKGYENG